MEALGCVRLAHYLKIMGVFSKVGIWWIGYRWCVDFVNRSVAVVECVLVRAVGL